jgi:hypothetical protein
MPSHVPSLLDIVTHTPLWVWALFALVLYMGYQRTRDRVVPLWRIAILPGVMLVLAATGWVNAGIATLPAIAVGVVIGGVAGWLLEREGATRRLPHGKLWLRGEWWSFLQILVILSFRYTITVVAAVNPVLNGDSTWHQGTLLISSLLTALFIGRAAARLRVYFTSLPAAA